MQRPKAAELLLLSSRQNHIHQRGRRAYATLNFESSTRAQLVSTSDGCFKYRAHVHENTEPTYWLVEQFQAEFGRFVGGLRGGQVLGHALGRLRTLRIAAFVCKYGI
eukprot:13575313-Alexandrium_andersonii.AAC.1